MRAGGEVLLVVLALVGCVRRATERPEPHSAVAEAVLDSATTAESPDRPVAARTVDTAPAAAPARSPEAEIDAARQALRADDVVGTVRSMRSLLAAGDAGESSIRRLLAETEDGRQPWLVTRINATGSPRVMPLLRDLLLSSPNAGVRSEAAIGIGHGVDTASEQTLLVAYRTEREPGPWRHILFAMGLVATPRLLDALRAHVLDASRSPGDRELAVKALAMRPGPGQAVLVELLDSPLDQALAYAVLEKLRDPEALATVETYRDRAPTEVLRTAAGRAAERLRAMRDARARPAQERK